MMKKTIKHSQYEVYDVREDKENADQVGKGIVTKTDAKQMRFEDNEFYLFEVFDENRFVCEWVLYDWKLLEYVDNS